MFRIIQTWWHIENKTHPSKSIVFKEVTDIYTDQQFIYYKITDFFVRLKIKNKFNNNELPFIQRKNLIQINLGDLKEWPSTSLSEGLVKHVKIEIKYVDVNPVFENSFPHLGYESTYDVDGITQPEFSITVPLGMKLKNKGKDIRLLLKKEKNEDVRLYYEDVNVDHVDGKNSYNILIRDDSYKEILSTPLNELGKIKVNYLVTNQFKFLFFPILPILLIIFAILENLFDPNGYSKLGITGSLTYMIIFVTFLTFYLTLSKVGFEIPWNKFTIILTPVSAFLLIIPRAIPYLITQIKLIFPMITSFLYHLIIQLY